MKKDFSTQRNKIYLSVALAISTGFCSNQGMWDQVSAANPMPQSEEETGTTVFSSVLSVKTDSRNLQPGSTYDFGTIGSRTKPSGAPVSFTIENTSTTKNVTVSSVSITGNGAKDFLLLSDFNGEITPGSSESIRIVFVPRNQGNRSARITISSNDRTQPEYTVDLTGTGEGDCAGPFNPASTRRIFVTTLDSYDGNLGGVTGADIICMNDVKAISAGGCFKAMLGQVNERSLNINWVMQANREYVKLDGITPVLKTNAAGGLTNNGDSPCSGTGGSYNLCNAISAAGHYWTGLNANWSVSSSRTCENWSSNSSSNKGRYGMANQTNNLSIQGTSSRERCHETRRLVCVEL